MLITNSNEYEQLQASIRSLLGVFAPIFWPSLTVFAICAFDRSAPKTPASPRLRTLATCAAS
jgi:hypothetical protein